MIYRELNFTCTYPLGWLRSDPPFVDRHFPLILSPATPNTDFSTMARLATRLAFLSLGTAAAVFFVFGSESESAHGRNRRSECQPCVKDCSAAWPGSSADATLMYARCINACTANGGCTVGGGGTTTSTAAATATSSMASVPTLPKLGEAPQSGADSPWMGVNVMAGTLSLVVALVL